MKTKLLARCNKFAHKACYDSTIVKPEIGIYYVCNLCNINFKTFKVVPDVEEVKEDTETFIITYPDKVLKSKPDERSTDTCPLFLEARCPFGLRGVGCDFFHPKSCYYYAKFGTDPFNGCRRGRRCKYIHPKLCPNSENMKICLNNECKLVHLKGTQRERRTNRENNNQQNPRYLERNEQSNYRYPEHNAQPRNDNATISPWENSQQHQITRDTNNTTPQPKTNGFENMQKNMQIFLEQCLERMKVDINKQIEHQVEGRINSFVNSKPVYQPTPAQWYHPQPATQAAQMQLEKPQEVTNTPPVQFMGYPMVIPPQPQNQC